MAIFFKVLAYAAVLSIFPCIFFMVRKHVALKGADQCAGVVIGHEERSDSDGSTYALRIEYSDSNLKKHTFVTGSASNPPARSIGEKVKVFHYGEDKKPDVLVFVHLFLGYWIWLCFSLTLAGCFIAPKIMEIIYLK